MEHFPVVHASGNMVFTQGRGFVFGASFGSETPFAPLSRAGMPRRGHPRFLFKSRTFGMIFVTLTSSALLRTGVVKTFRCAD